MQLIKSHLASPPSYMSNMYIRPITYVEAYGTGEDLKDVNSVSADVQLINAAAVLPVIIGSWRQAGGGWRQREVPVLCLAARIVEHGQ